MQILHIVKTASGARWAAQQAKCLTDLGINVHVAIPELQGEAMPYWEAANVTFHRLDCSLPLKTPYLFSKRARAIQNLVTAVKPDLIHSHFVTTSIMLRFALNTQFDIPRIFQVPGPLHLEHNLYRQAEIRSANQLDYWVASSKYIKNLYLKSGIPSNRLFLSYYGSKFRTQAAKEPINLRQRFNLPASSLIIGNVNYMYPPKYYLGQTTGLKRHEDIIDALGIITQKRDNVFGIIAGGQWGGKNKYEKTLHRRAARLTKSKIYFTGLLTPAEAQTIWQNFDAAVHVPISENCGGVVEPLVNDVPTIAGKVGGLSEVVIDGKTGWLVPTKNPKQLASAIELLLDNPVEAKKRAQLGGALAKHMFDVSRTAGEVAEIYRHILGKQKNRPTEFDSRTFIQTLEKTK